jgi:hypothetical protein
MINAPGFRMSARVFHSALVFAPVAGLAQTMPAPSFAGSAAPAEMEGGAAASTAQDSGLYADGMRAINEARWADAEALFTKTASQPGEHSDGSLYWKARAKQTREDESGARHLRRTGPQVSRQQVDP